MLKTADAGLGLDKYFMRIDEVVNGLKTFVAQLRVSSGGGSMVTVKTTVTADGMIQARMILGTVFGPSNVLSLVEAPSQLEETGTKVLSSAELQVKSLADQSMRIKKQATALKARQAMAKAQKQLQAAQTAR